MLRCARHWREINSITKSKCYNIISIFTRWKFSFGTYFIIKWISLVCGRISRRGSYYWSRRMQRSRRMHYFWINILLIIRTYIVISKLQTKNGKQSQKPQECIQPKDEWLNGWNVFGSLFHWLHANSLPQQHTKHNVRVLLLVQSQLQL